MRSKFLCAIGLVLTLPLWAQKINDPVRDIEAMSMAQVHQHMTAMAKAVNESAPIQADSVTTIVSAGYLRDSKSYGYRVSLAENVPPDVGAARIKATLCTSRINVALMARGVLYIYSVTTPKSSYIATFSYYDC